MRKDCGVNPRPTVQPSIAYVAASSHLGNSISIAPERCASDPRKSASSIGPDGIFRMRPTAAHAPASSTV